MKLQLKMNQKRALISFALCLSLIASGMIGAAIAKYISTINGSSNAGVAVWSIEVNDQQIASPEAQTFTFDLFDTLYEEDCTTPELHVSPGVIAPGTGGSFTLKVENLSQVDAELNMVLTEQNENSIPIQYSTDRNTWHDDLLFLQYLFTDFFLERETGIATQTVFWRWCYTGSGTAHAGQADSGDTALGYLALNGEVTLGILADVTAAQYLPHPDAPAQDLLASEEITETSITLKAIDGAEYSMDGITWQDSSTFNGLNSGTEYTFYIRYKETPVSGASKASTVRLSTPIVYTDFTITVDNLAKIGYTGTENEELVIPEAFYDDEDQTWYRVTGMESWYDEGNNDDLGPFAYCNFSSVTIPGSIAEIIPQAFYNCWNLQSVTVLDGVTTICDSAFANLPNLSSVRLADSVNVIDGSAFWGCNSLSDVDLGSGVTTIGNSAFYDCTSLTSIHLPDNVSSIGSNAFYGCDNLTEISFGSEITSIGEDAFQVRYPENFTGYKLPTLVIGGNDTIWNYWWEGDSRIVTFDACDATVEYIVTAENRAFTGYHESFPDLTIVSTYYEDLDEVWYRITGIDEYAFADCTNLERVYIADGVNSIGSYAFQNCSNLKQIILPNGITTIDHRTFSYCSALTRITIPESVEYIYSSAFENCTSLTTVTIPDGVIEVGDSAFVSCTNLESVYIPKSVTYLGYGAFMQCPNLTDIYFAGSEAEWDALTSGDDTDSYGGNKTVHFNYTGE